MAQGLLFPNCAVDCGGRSTDGKGGLNVNADILKGSWKQAMGHLKFCWGRLRRDDLTQVKGQREILLGKLQATYGRGRRKLERQLRGIKT